MTNVFHRRTQYAVGQGFFHAGFFKLNKSGGTDFVYVYDCGAMERYKDARNREINQFKSELNGRSIDLMFLSHLHADHVSGLPELLAGSAPVRAKTIVLPYTGLSERAILFAKDTALGAWGEDMALARDLTIDPVGTISQRFGPDEIIIVHASEPDDEPGPGPEPRPGEDKRDAGWVFKRFSPARRSSAPRRVGRSNVQECSDRSELSILRFAWGFFPHVKPIDPSRLQAFRAALARELSLELAHLDSLLSSPDELRDLLVNSRTKLRDAYKAISSDLNVTSLSILSRPYEDPEKFLWNVDVDHPHRWPLGCWCCRDTLLSAIGWLGTGDADLKTVQEAQKFCDHYSVRGQSILTMTLPHHGSDHNFNPKLIEFFRPTFAVAPADEFANWRHPGSGVVRRVAERGARLEPVTSDPQTRFMETFQRW
ncbi:MULTISPECIES: MBL fold metallo-hydrolase [Hyphobacterium]|uniref:MBL fold metallo-hydrolase n=1 Tax=Hyphobacterium vulgare TaxID=1736751 RepID=A0ABV6ZX22_9PROT